MLRAHVVDVRANYSWIQKQKSTIVDDIRGNLSESIIFVNYTNHIRRFLVFIDVANWSTLYHFRQACYVTTWLIGLSVQHMISTLVDAKGELDHVYVVDDITMNGTGQDIIKALL